MRNAIRYIISKYGGKVINRIEMEKVMKKFSSKVENTINFMISYGYLVRILRGLYYVKTVEEFKLKKSPDIYEILSLGMNKLRVKWYFGLYTALRLNGLTHEYFDTIFIINDKIFRAKEIKVMGEKVKFIKLKPRLLSFGIKNDKIPFSDIEKTLLDFTYIFRYRSVPEEKILSFIEEYKDKMNKKRLIKYMKFYPKSIRKMMEDAKLI